MQFKVFSRLFELQFQSFIEFQCTSPKKYLAKIISFIFIFKKNWARLKNKKKFHPKNLWSFGDKLLMLKVKVVEILLWFTFSFHFLDLFLFGRNIVYTFLMKGTRKNKSDYFIGLFIPKSWILQNIKSFFILLSP